MTAAVSVRGALRGLVAVLVWGAVAVPAWVLLVENSSADIQVAGHDAVVQPTLDGWSVLRTGPFLPDVRMPSGHTIGAEITVGKTEAASAPEMVQRYAVLAARPEGEVQRITAAVEDLVVTAAARAAVIGALPLVLWVLIGGQRRRELLRPRRHQVVIAGMTVTAVVVVLLAPWKPQTERVHSTGEWTPIARAVPSLAVPAEFGTVQVQGGALTSATTRLVESAFDTFANSRVFYDEVEQRVREAAGELREPAEDETVGILLSDRHDNVGMDRVAATIGREAGATVVLDAGDDTSTGATWEAFSLDSLDEAFSDYDVRVSVAGNHDHGSFVSRHLRELGWTTLDGREATLFGGVRISGANDPRSSGLGNWRDETGLSFADVQERFSDELCRLDEKGKRVATVLVHDANQARPAWEQGCVDLVVGGHVHSPSGPTISRGERGVGYTYTNGTTGGAAYAFAMGSKLRREAMVTLITWSEGRPIGLQPVTIRTTGAVDVGSFVRLTY